MDHPRDPHVAETRSGRARTRRPRRLVSAVCDATTLTILILAASAIAVGFYGTNPYAPLIALLGCLLFVPAQAVRLFVWVRDLRASVPQSPGIWPLRMVQELGQLGVFALLTVYTVGHAPTVADRVASLVLAILLIALQVVIATVETNTRRRSEVVATSGGATPAMGTATLVGSLDESESVAGPEDQPEVADLAAEHAQAIAAAKAERAQIIAMKDAERAAALAAQADKHAAALAEQDAGHDAALEARDRAHASALAARDAEHVKVLAAHERARDVDLADQDATHRHALAAAEFEHNAARVEWDRERAALGERVLAAEASMASAEQARQKAEQAVEDTRLQAIADVAAARSDERHRITVALSALTTDDEAIRSSTAPVSEYAARVRAVVERLSPSPTDDPSPAAKRPEGRPGVSVEDVAPEPPAAPPNRAPAEPPTGERSRKRGLFRR